MRIKIPRFRILTALASMLVSCTHGTARTATRPSEPVERQGAIGGAAQPTFAQTQPLVLHAGDNLVANIAFTPDGKQLVSVGWDMTVRLWDLVSGQEVGRFVGHTSSVIHVAVSSDGKWIATGSQDRTLRLWDIKSRMEIHQFKNTTFDGPAVSFSPDGSRLAGSDFQGVHIWDMSTYKQVLWLSDPHGDVTNACFSADGKLIGTTLDSGGTGWNGAGVWDASSGKMLARFPATTANMPDGSGPEQLSTWRADFSSDGKFLVTAAPDGVRVWEIASQKLVTEISQTSKMVDYFDFGGSVGFVAARFSHDGHYLLMAGDNNALYILEVGSWRVLRKYHGYWGWSPLGDQYFTDAEFSKDDSKIAASSTDGSVCVWQFSPGPASQPGGR